MAMVVIEMGGTNVKRLAMGKRMPRKVLSGPTMSTRHMIDAFRQLVADWSYDAIALEYPGAVRAGRPAVETKNLGRDE